MNAYELYKATRRIRSRAPSSQIEYQEHVQLAAYLKDRGIFFTISPAGIKLAPRVGMKFKRMGYRPGTYDFLIFEPRGGCYGLFLEMKRPAIAGVCDKGSVSAEQIEFGAQANNRGYLAMVCYGWQEGKKIVDEYLAH